MKRYLVLFLGLVIGLMAKGQSLSVASFKLIENDLTAITHGTEVKDQNGHTCALIKVETTQTGFTFDVGMMGVMKTEQHTGEIWVYVPFGVKKITIQHQQFGTLRDYYFPCSIEQGKTYIMQLISGNVTTIVEKDMGGSYLIINVEPKNAMVYVDDKLKTINDGTVSLMLPYGKHTYRVEAPSYLSEAGVIEIGHERKELFVKLVSAMAKLTVKCADAEALIFVNDQQKATGNWSGQLDEGMYMVEVRKEGHRTEKQSITLAKQEQKTINMNAPMPIYGKLNLTSTPDNCEVYIDGKQVGKSPDVFSNILIGNHTVELRKDGYASNQQQVAISENSVSSVDIKLEKLSNQKQETVAEIPDASNSISIIGKWKIANPTGYSEADKMLYFTEYGAFKDYYGVQSGSSHDYNYTVTGDKVRYTNGSYDNGQFRYKTMKEDGWTYLEIYDDREFAGKYVLVEGKKSSDNQIDVTNSVGIIGKWKIANPVGYSEADKMLYFNEYGAFKDYYGVQSGSSHDYNYTVTGDKVRYTNGSYDNGQFRYKTVKEGSRIYLEIYDDREFAGKYVMVE